VVGIRGSYMDRIICHDQESWARENSAEALADAIESLTVQKLQKLGTASARRAGLDYTWPRVFEQIFCIYDEVCSNYTGSGHR